MVFIHDLFINLQNTQYFTLKVNLIILFLFVNMSSSNEILGKSNQSKNIITYSIIGVVFLIALWLSSQSDGPSKFPKVVTKTHNLVRNCPSSEIWS